MHSDKLRILCAENYQDTREYLVICLDLAGYEVTPGDTVAECVELAASRRFHLYLIGERFPDGSGFDLVEKIRSFDGQTPLVFHSALAYPKDIERGMNAGAQAYITKPSDPRHLVETIRLLIDTDDRKKRGFPTAAMSA
jgi:DNA-binding response OmpR family regulator